jgi:cAMP-specific phosphodiesterase 4
MSSASHDIDHPGNNNVYESKIHSKLATLYNDASVLENHHAASFFFLVEDEESNIFKQFNLEDFNRMRKYIVDNILNTDMSKHFSLLNEIKNMT